MSSSASDIDLLDRVLVRLASSDTDEKFEKTVGAILCPVLLKLSSQDEGVRTKVMEVLTHINKRVKLQPQVKLPTEALLAQYGDTTQSQLVHNFTIMYLETALAKMAPADKSKYVPDMVGSLKGRPANHQNTLLRMIAPLLGDVQMPTDPKAKESLYGLDKEPAVRALLLGFLLDVLLCEPSTSKAYAAAFAAGATPSADDAAQAVPGGLSQGAVARVTNNGTTPVTVATKAGTAEFLSSGVFTATEVLCHMVVAAADTHHTVATKGEYGLKRIGHADYEDDGLVRQMFSLVQGYVAPAAGAPETPAAERRRPVPARVKVLLLPHLIKSTKATNMFPNVIKVIFESAFGGDTNQKLKVLGLQLMQSVCERSHDNMMRTTAAVLMQAPKNILANNTTENADDVKLRSIAYLLYGKIAKRQPQLFAGDIAVLTQLFEAIERETANMRLYITESIQMIAQGYKAATLSPAIKESLYGLFLKAVNSSNGHLRLAGIQCAKTIFPLNDVPSRLICMIGAGDHQEDVKEEARAGLRPPRLHEQAQVGAKAPSMYPDFQELVRHVMAKAVDRFLDPMLRYQSGLGAIAFEPNIFVAVLGFLRTVLAAAAGSPYPVETDKEESDGEIEARKAAITKYIQSLPALTLSEEPEFGEHASLADMRSAVDSGNVLDAYRVLVEQALSNVATPELHLAAASCLDELVDALPEELSVIYLQRLQWMKTFTTSAQEPLRKSMSRVLGIVASHALGEPLASLLEGFTPSLQSSQNPDVRHLETIFGALSATGHIVGQCVLRGRHTELPALRTSTKYLARFIDASRTDLALAGMEAIGEVGRHGPLPLDAGAEESTDEITANEREVTRVYAVARLVERVKSSKENKVIEGAVTTIGLLGLGDAALPRRAQALEALYGLQREKSPELHFSVGMALARHGMKADASVLDGVLDEALKGVRSAAPPVRQSACIWLMFIVKYNQSHAAVKSKLPQIQQAFSLLLGDKDEFTQECASNGLGLVYQCGDETMKKALVDTLVDTLMSGTKERQKLSQDTELFTDEIGKTPDGANMTTYKDLCNLVSELNQPDLIYKFMALSNHNALWNSRKGAAFGFASIANLAGEQMDAYMPTLVPKLYRYKHDPNARTRQAMSHIWASLKLDNVQTVKKYHGEILEDLRENIVHKQWRNREASCLALSDYLNIMQTDVSNSVFEELWTLCFRAIDDIKESVRKAGAIASKSLVNITQKKCDPSINADKDKCKEAIGIAIPLLLNKGVTSTVEEVQGLSLQTIQLICKAAGKYVTPYATELVLQLLQSQSELEPAALNYLAFHVEKSGISQERVSFEDMRTAAAKMSPMAETIDTIIKNVDDSVLPTLIPRLLDAVKGIGLQTKVSAAQLLATLLDPKKSLDTKPYTPKVVRALTGCLKDKSPAVRKACATALSYIVKVASDKTMDRLIEELRAMVLASEDKDHRYASGFTMREIGRHAPDVFSRFQTNILPIAFVALHDDDKEVGAVFENVWDENTPGKSSGVRLYQDELVALLLPMLTSASWSQKKVAAVTISDMATSIGAALDKGSQKVLPALVQSLGGRTWDGKEAVLQAVADVVTACKGSIPKESKANESVGYDEIVATVLKECGRKTRTYVRIAVKCLGAVVEAENGDRYEQVKDVLYLCIKPEPEESDEDDDTKRKAQPLLLALQEAAFRSLGQAWPATYSTQAKHANWHFNLLADDLESNVWNVRVAILEALKSFFAKLHVASAEGKQGLLTSGMVQRLDEVLSRSLEDAKYTVVRLGALAVYDTLLTTIGQQGKAADILAPEQRAVMEKTLRAHRAKGDAETKAKCDAVLDKLSAAVQTGGS